MTGDTMQATSWQETVVLPVGRSDDEDAGVLRELALRKMTGNEEALLVDPKLRANGGKLVTALLASCARDEGGGRVAPARIRALASADRNFLLLELRRLTFGDEMHARYTCPRCQQVTAVVEDLATIDVRRIDEDFDFEVTVELVDGYRDPDGEIQRELVFGLPTGADEEAAGALRDANPARQRDVLLARCLLRVGELEPRRMRALGPRVLAELSMSDRRLIQAALDAAAPGPDLTRSVVCDHCLEEFRAALDMSHFFPIG